MDIEQEKLPELDGFRTVRSKLIENDIATISGLNQLAKSEKDISDFAEKANLPLEKVQQYYKESIQYYENAMKMLDYDTRKDMIDMLKKDTRMKAALNLVFAVLLFLAGIYFIVHFIVTDTETITDCLAALTNLGSGTVFTTPEFWLVVLHFVYLVVGILFLQYAVVRLQQRMIVKNFSGLSQIQYEIISGLGETRPLVQIIQSTLGNAAKTFSQSLIVGRAMFWTGLAFVIIALFQILVLGRISYNEVAVGGVGILTWLVSTFITNRKEVQESLYNITQLEFILAGLAKKFTAVDLYVSKDSTLKENLFKESIDAITSNVSKSLASMELYTKTMDKVDDEVFLEIIKKELEK